MCTAITFSSSDFYFGRTLDVERCYGQQLVITPRNFSLRFRHVPALSRHFAIIGMAQVAQAYPLYFDAVNEAGLCAAGLSFPGYSQYFGCTDGKSNVASFELIPWLLAQCGSLEEVRALLPHLQITDTPFSPLLPPTPLHWLIADKSGCITVESMSDGIHVHENPVGVLTNSPPFDMQLLHLSDYMHLSPGPPISSFAPGLETKPYSRGMGAIGLPGDLSSRSRFVRAAFTKLNSVSAPQDAVSQFFHIMDSVKQIRGSCRLENGSCELSLYTSCCNASRGIYYFTTYSNRRIRAVDMHTRDLESSDLLQFSLRDSEDIKFLD